MPEIIRSFLNVTLVKITVAEEEISFMPPDIYRDRHKRIFAPSGEIFVNEIKLQNLLELITIEKYKDDYLLYNCYLLDKKMLDKLSELAEKVIEYDLEKFEYYLEAAEK